MLLLVPLLQAHPGSSTGSDGAPRDTIGHRIELTVGATEVEIRYIAEVPERRVLEEARATGAPGYGEKLLASLTDGVALTWDGAVLPSTPVPVAEPVAGGEKGFLDFVVVRHAVRAAGRGTLGVRNGNFPDVDGFFATSVTLDGSLLAEETSLLKVKQGRIRDNWHGAWLKDESGREPWVRVRPAGWGQSSPTPAPLPQRMAGLEGEGPPPWFFGVLVLLLVPIAWLGRKLGQRARRLRE
ncbi:MAG: hypothetical protein Q8P41_06595 [Pseudomonadota bacterium]|nr:hypothetical protein [Pseudomonadota bacterium]